MVNEQRISNIYNPANLKSLSAGLKKEHRKLFRKLKTYKPTLLDDKIHTLHHKIFEEEIDCLKCANCCKSISPAITDRDIQKLSQALGKTPGEIVKTYLDMDEEGDYVFHQQPCPFLGDDNYCAVYDFRPKACREYPHTNRKKMYQILELTRQNIKVCPAVFSIVEELRKE